MDQGAALERRCAMTPPKPTHVYVIGFSDLVIKVGRTSNPESRFKQHAQDARVRRARIVQSWTFETDQAEYAEVLLKQLGRGYLEPLTGEYFRGKYNPFMRKVRHRFERWGLIPIDSLSFHEAAERAGVTEKELLRAREREEIRQDVYLPGSIGMRFATAAVDRWAVAHHLREEKEAAEWEAHQVKYAARKATERAARMERRAS